MYAYKKESEPRRQIGVYYLRAPTTVPVVWFPVISNLLLVGPQPAKPTNSFVELNEDQSLCAAVDGAFDLQWVLPRYNIGHDAVAKNSCHTHWSSALSGRYSDRLQHHSKVVSL